MDLYEEGFFVHIFGDIKSANLIFEIPSAVARGTKETLQISIVSDISSQIHLGLAKELLETFEKEMKHINNAYKAFYISKESDEESLKIFKEVQNLFISFLKSLKPAIRALKQAEIRYQTLFKAARDGIIIIEDKTGKIVDINLQSEKILGVKRKEIIGSNVKKIGVFDNYEELNKRILELVEKEDPQPIEIHLKTQQGRVIPVEANGNKIQMGAHALIQIIFRDITERKKQEQRILESEQNLKKKVKELHSLYEITKLIEQPYLTISQTLQKSVELIPNALKYPNLACARILFKDNVFRTENFLATQWKVSTHIKIGENLMDIDSFYFKDRQFLDDEVFLLYEIASRLKSVIEQKEYEEMVKKRLEFEKIVATFSSRFVHISDFDEIVSVGLRNLGELSDASRVYVNILNEDSKTYDNVYIWQNKDIDVENKLELDFKSKLIEHWISNFHEHSFIHIKDVTTFDNESELIQKLSNQEVASILIYPITMGDKILGFIGIDKLRDPIEWDEDVFGILRIFCELLGNALERRKSEEKLKQSQKEYKNLIDNSLEGLMVIDERQDIILANPSIETILGYKIHELLGNSLYSLMDDDKKEIMKAHIEKRMKGIRETYDFEFNKKSGEKVYTRLKASPIYDEEGRFKGSMAFFTDITERKKAKEELIKSEFNYRSAYKQANFYKDLFTHDINNVFSNLKSSVELLSMNLEDNSVKMSNTEIVDLLRDQISRGFRLLDNVQKISLLEDEEIDIKAINLCEHLKEAIRYVKTNFTKRLLNISVNYIKSNYMVKANDFLLDVFENLLINATKYNENPFVIIQINIIEKEEENFLRAEFVDNGIGISDDRKTIIFHKGFKEQKGKKGMGLGLYLVKTIVDKYGGKIWIEDKVKGNYSKGSKFVISLEKSS